MRDVRTMSSRYLRPPQNKGQLGFIFRSRTCVSRDRHTGNKPHNHTCSPRMSDRNWNETGRDSGARTLLGSTGHNLVNGRCLPTLAARMSVRIESSVTLESVLRSGGEWPNSFAAWRSNVDWPTARPMYARRNLLHRSGPDRRQSPAPQMSDVTRRQRRYEIGTRFQIVHLIAKRIVQKCT